MANHSTAQGFYRFQFSKNTTASQRLGFIKRLNQAINHSYSFYTELEYTAIGEIEEHEIAVSVPFTGVGRWAYENNIEWFKTEEDYADILKSMKNLTIEIEYTDYDMDFLGRGSAVITVKKGQIDITENQFERKDFTLENFLEYELGDKADYYASIGEEYHEED